MAEGILKSIYSYLDVLSMASTLAVQHWDKQSLQHALQWAEYCEKVYIQAQGKRYEKELDHQIKQLDHLPSAVTLPHIDLKMLRHAESHLRKALLQNPHLTADLFEYLLQSYGDVHVAADLDTLAQDCYEISSTKASAHIGCLLLEHALPVIASENCGGRKVEEISVHAQAQLFLLYVIRTMKIRNEGIRHATLLEEKFETLAATSSGMLVMLKSLVVNTHNPDFSRKDRQDACFMIMKWILLRSNKERLWNQPCHLLCQVSSAYFSFYQRYMQHLVHTANSLPTHNLDHDNLTYDTIKHHLRALCDTEGQVSMATRKTVISLVSSQHSSVWGQFVRELNLEDL